MSSRCIQMVRTCNSSALCCMLGGADVNGRVSISWELNAAFDARADAFEPHHVHADLDMSSALRSTKPCTHVLSTSHAEATAATSQPRKPYTCIDLTSASCAWCARGLRSCAHLEMSCTPDTSRTQASNRTESSPAGWAKSVYLVFTHCCNTNADLRIAFPWLTGTSCILMAFSLSC